MDTLKLERHKVGSCNCLTKTPEVKYHDELCYYRLIEEKTESVADVPCNVGLSDVLNLLKKDIELSNRLVEDMKAKDDEEMVEVFTTKRGHTRELIRQIEALGR